MKPKHLVISLPAKDLAKSIAFYKDAIGLKTDSPADATDGAEFAIKDGLSLMLIPQKDFEGFTKGMPVASGATECILSCAFNTKAEVDDLLARVEKSDGTVLAKAKEEQWGYIGYFKDPDGHMWELVWSQRGISEGR